MSTWYKIYLLACFLLLPFLIAAAFKFTDWMGWPALIVFGLYWFGSIIQLKDAK